MTPSTGLPYSRSVRLLLDVEDSEPSELLEPLPGTALPLWPRVRMFFASALAAVELGETGVPQRQSRAKTYRRLARSFLPSRHDAAWLRGRSPVVMVASGVTTSRERGYERNWLVGDLAEALGPEATLLQWTPPHPGIKPAFPRTRSLDAINARTDLRTYRRELSTETATAIDVLVHRYAALFSGAISAEQERTIAASVRYQERRAPLLQDAFLTVIDRLDPHTVVLEDASYGHRGGLIQAMKKDGRHVAEPQHGWIGPSHAAYNYGSIFRHEGLHSQIPDELLLFGEYWGRSIQHPATLTTIGKPHLQRAMASAPPVADRENIALIASSITDPDATTSLILALRKKLPGWRLRFRPHPSERATLADRYPSLIDVVGVEIDPHDDLYESLADCRAVVGVASTVLFEAASFGCDVLVRRSPFTEYYVGELFGPAYDDARDVEAMAARLRAGNTPVDVESFWAPHSLDLVRRWALSTGTAD
ncbi:hypothetical protein M0722_04675 [Microbacterium sp. KSW4-16]|uniref:hypothetical protein n=1 Tax=Microbacterium aurugineum TaxID=2851642 RepID=UPI0020C1805F|nr:hypothetical protein [Microbacterium aurugineum]MCK8466476.1 hypothetical protein [Microbacterium aurugineum]